MKKILLGFVVALGLLGCDQQLNEYPPESKFLSHMVDVLKDPDSAKYKDKKIYKNGNVFYMCGWVNAKNGFGAYTGYDRFVVMEVGVPFVDDGGSHFKSYWDKNCKAGA